MASHSIITVGTTDSVKVTPGNIHSGIDITIQNINSSGFVYIGADENVSSSDYGFRLSPGNAWSVELSGQDHIYIIGSAADLDVAVMQLSLEAGN